MTIDRSGAKVRSPTQSELTDRSMVIGPDPNQPTFGWCVGQGGTGIQTAPGAGRLTAGLALGVGPSPAFRRLVLDEVRPERFRG